MSAKPRALTIAILAMGGEGGGVLADWIVDLAERNGFVAQATSVPGVAQRTGATVYYLELFPRGEIPAGAQPVLALAPVSGELDVVVASELMEAGRALQQGLVSKERSTFIVSTHRVYSMTERTSRGDGRVDATKLLEGAREGAARLIAADFAALAEQSQGPIAPALFGALAASKALPFDRSMFEDAIRHAGVGVQSSLQAFDAGFTAALVPKAAPLDAPGAALGPRLAALGERIDRDFPSEAHEMLRHAVLRLAEYQDTAYAQEYLDTLLPLRDAGIVLVETGRHLALWMSYEDAVRVADLKTRRSRFQRVEGEVRLAPSQLLDINEFMHPRVDEIADILPAALGRWLMRPGWGRTAAARLTQRGRIVRTSTIGGYLLLYMIASMRSLRRRSLRFRVEHDRMAVWLGEVQRLAAAKPALALEVARAQRLVKGYGDTHAHGWRGFQRLMGVLPALEADPAGAQRLGDLANAALSDDTGAALERMLATV
ncbi:MAG: indolepyruvate oxidoreductase subunit beta family protein [Betaproteobacteria bacterium]|nr:indolepyruvate oxidoreductase subunit beta family protein [Betaproteobacteria bacterium]